MLTDFYVLLKEICRWGNVQLFVESEGQADPEEHKEKAILYTTENKYQIVAIQRSTGKNYLGCQVSKRKPRAGEDWVRGNDLPDGEFSRETWQNIKDAIIAYELVRIPKTVRLKTTGETKENVNAPS